MRRRPPAISAPHSVSPNYDEKQLKENRIKLVRQTREYELITPLFGGGTETQKADPVSVIRVPSIRGQLRFWWRAIRGGQFDGSLERLKRREDEIFGAPSLGDESAPSQVQIDLTITNRGTDFSTVEIRRRGQNKQVHVSDISSPYGYVAFPLREGSREGSLSLRARVRFLLSISYPTGLSPEIEAALWAWEVFGGLGGRTRRGFGAVQRKNYRPTSIQRDIEEEFQNHLAGTDYPQNVPHLVVSPTTLKITSAHGSVSDVWEYLIKALRDFRQDRPWNPATGRPGRSNWHEPDAIRRLTRNSPEHLPRPTTVDSFPRAAFGLPIIFKFANEGDGDPRQTTLEGADENQKRMASPLIFRPLECADGRAVGIVALLAGTTTPPRGVILKEAPGNPLVRTDVTTAEATRIAPLGGNSNVLQHFLSKLT